jgi:hypothetical protein
MPDFNISIVPPATPSAPKSNNQNTAAPVKVATQSVTRNIAPLTKYNSETGTLDVDEATPWGQSAPAAEVESETTAPEPTTNDRHTKWKSEQAAKRQAKAERQAAKAANQQRSVRELLAAGDIAGAAAALDMSPADFMVLTQNAALRIPTEPDKLSPEQKKAQEEESFRNEYAAFKKEQEQFRYQQVASSYIKDNIDPVLADKDKFELINAPGNDVKKIKSVIYEYMNKHYSETSVYDNKGNLIKEGQILNPADIAETIEQQMYESLAASAERIKQMKKTSKLFQQQEQEQEAETLEQQLQEPSARGRLAGNRAVSVKSDLLAEPTVANKQARPLDSRFPTRDAELDQEEEEELNETANVPTQAVKRTGSGKNTHFALLSREERLALMKSGR